MFPPLSKTRPRASNLRGIGNVDTLRRVADHR